MTAKKLIKPSKVITLKLHGCDAKGGSKYRCRGRSGNSSIVSLKLSTPTTISSSKCFDCDVLVNFMSTMGRSGNSQIGSNEKSCMITKMVSKQCVIDGLSDEWQEALDPMAIVTVAPA